MKIIKRNTYLNKLINVKDVPDIKVITGVRRAGKSKLMDLYNDYLNNEGNNIIHIKLNLKKFEKLLNADNLYNYISNSYVDNKNNYLLIDEIQMCEGFERIITDINIGEIQKVVNIKNIGLRKSLELLEQLKYLIYKEYSNGMYTIKLN